MTARENLPGRVPAVRHYGGFVLSGILALIADAVVLVLLSSYVGVPPLLARPVSIGVAMIVSWRINRFVTFAYPHAPTVAEFARFAAVSWTAQAVNYAIFAVIMVWQPDTHPVAALIAASFVSMFVSYAGFRFGVFRAK